MSGDQAIRTVNAVTQLLGVLVWPTLLLFFMVWFRRNLGDFLSNLGEFRVKAPGLEAEAKRRQVEAAAAIGAAIATRGSSDEVPTAAPHPREIAEALPSPRIQRRLEDQRILWVDDRPRNNVFEAQALEALGLRVDLSTSTDDALEQLQRRSYDLIISDMGRPPDARAGYTLLDALRQSGDHTPYIIYASSRAPEHIAEARRHGAIGSTNAPQELISMVTRALS